MLKSIVVMAGVLIAATVIVRPSGLAVGGPGAASCRLGVGLTVDSGWIALDSYFVRGRGTAVRDQAWADGNPSRGATSTRFFRLGAVPNPVGMIQRNLVVVRALRRALNTTARHVLRQAVTPDIGKETGVRDADRR